jgi:hypothetical protein
MTYPELVPEKPLTCYVPRVFGFKMHTTCDGKPKSPAVAIAAAAAAELPNTNSHIDVQHGN